MITSLCKNGSEILELWCHQPIGILDAQLMLKFKIFNSIRVRVLSVYVIFPTSRKPESILLKRNCSIFIYLYIYIFIYLYIYIFIYLYIYLFIYLYIYIFIYLYIYIFIYLYIYIFIYLYIYIFIYLYIYVCVQN